MLSIFGWRQYFFHEKTIKTAVGTCFWGALSVAVQPHDPNEVPRVSESQNRLLFPLRQTFFFINKPEKDRRQHDHHRYDR